jgi:preprotein translocase subunit SecE
VNQTTKTSPIEFYRQVRQEVSKVTWPSRKETTVTTSMVFLMVLVLAFFFLVIDQMASFLVRTILSFGG